MVDSNSQEFPLITSMDERILDKQLRVLRNMVRWSIPVNVFELLVLVGLMTIEVRIIAEG